MIILILTGILIVLSIVAYICLQNYRTEILGFIVTILTFIVGVFTALFLIVFICVHIPLFRNQELAEYQQTYYAITQMMDDKDVAVVTLTSQIAEYNANVLKGRMMQDSLLWHTLDYDFYYDLPLIEFEDTDGEN